MDYLVFVVCLLICTLHIEVFCADQPPQPKSVFKNRGDGMGGMPVNSDCVGSNCPGSTPQGNQRNNRAYPDPVDRNPPEPKPCFGSHCPENSKRFGDLPVNPWLPQNRPSSPTKPKRTCKHGHSKKYPRRHHHRHHHHHHHDSYYDHSGDSHGYPNDDFNSPDCESKENKRNNDRNMADCNNKDCSECNGYGCIFSP